MNEDEVARRLRRALHAKAQRMVAPTEPVPEFPAGAARRPMTTWLSLAAAAAVVLAVAGGVVAVRSVGDHSHHDAVPAPTTSSTPSIVHGTEPVAPVGAPSESATAAPTATPSGTPTKSRTHRTHSDQPAGSSHPSSGPGSPTGSAPPSGGQPAPCNYLHLFASVAGHRTANSDGGEYVLIDVQNTGPTCTISGLPAIKIWQRGVLISDDVGMRDDYPEQTLTLEPNGKVEFDIYDEVLPNGGYACRSDTESARWLEIDITGDGVPVGADPVAVDPYSYSACQLSVGAFHLP